MIPEIEPAYTTPFAMLTAPGTHALTITWHTMGGILRGTGSRYFKFRYFEMAQFGSLIWPTL
jgi:hypothetical protein